jgi:hypothetical protein
MQAAAALRVKRLPRRYWVFLKKWEGLYAPTRVVATPKSRRKAAPTWIHSPQKDPAQAEQPTKKPSESEGLKIAVR